MQAIQARAPVSVEFKGVKKDFAGTPVLNDVTLSFYQGEVHGLLGENGAGKSTLIKILTGVYSASSGTILVGDKEAHIHSPLAAHKLGLGAIYQDAELIPSFTVAENILLGHETGIIGINRSRIRKEASRILQETGLNLDPDRLASELTAAEMQLVSLAMLFHRKYKVVILDEPTARLSSHEAEILFRMIRRFKESGITVIYISHRLNEIKLLCDRATVMRGGRVAATLERDDLNEDHITRLMTDRSKSELDVVNDHKSRSSVRLSFEGVHLGRLQPLSFDVRQGEVLGITGPIGSGMEEIEGALGGLRTYSGEIRVDGQHVVIGDPRASRRAGVVLIPEDRRKQALFPNLSLADNIVMPLLRNVSRAGFVPERGKQKVADAVIRQLNVQPQTPSKPVKFFSGGNQQKAVIGKWFQTNGKVYIFVEPTAGVDVGAIREIYQIIIRLAHSGAAVLVISSSIREILTLSETVMVIHEGRKTYHGSPKAVSYNNLLALSMGGQAGDS